MKKLILLLVMALSLSAEMLSCYALYGLRDGRIISTSSMASTIVYDDIGAEYFFMTYSLKYTKMPSEYGAHKYNGILHSSNLFWTDGSKVVLVNETTALGNCH